MDGRKLAHTMLDDVYFTIDVNDCALECIDERFLLVSLVHDDSGGFAQDRFQYDLFFSFQ